MSAAVRAHVLRYGVAVWSVAAVTLVRLLLQPDLGSRARFLSYVLAVMFSGWYGGLGPGLLATALSALLGPVLFPEAPERALSFTDRYAVTELVFFCVIGAVVSILNQMLRSEVVERRHAEQASRAQARALLDVIERLAQERDLERFEGLVLVAIVNQLHAASGELWCYHEACDAFEIALEFRDGKVAAGKDSRNPLAGRKVTSRDVPGWEVFNDRGLRGECVQVPDLAKDALLPEDSRLDLLERGIRSLLVVPVLLQDRLAGFYVLQNSQPMAHGPGEIRIAQALAHQATLAMKLTRLAEQARQGAVLEERNRMAREIHDTLAQGFTGVLMQLEAAKLRLPGEPQRGEAHIETAREIARQGLAEARRSAHALRPLALERQDLAGALASMARQLSVEQQTDVHFQTQGPSLPLPADVADHLLRIAQEAVNNALRHARATRIDIELAFSDRALRLYVQDDGHGIPGTEGVAIAPQLRQQNGIGLAGMRERAALIGAQISVTSEAGRGTRVEVTRALAPERSETDARVSSPLA